MRIVVDTGVFVSALWSPNGFTADLLTQLLAKHEVLVSTALLDEIADVLRRPKFAQRVSIQTATAFRQLLYQYSTEIEVTSELTVCADPDDDILFELATDGQADYIISGDRKVLALDPFGQVRVVSPRGFVEELRVKD